MKNLKQAFLLLMVAFAFNINAQTIGNYIDVIQFKNGTSIKGVIIAQVPGESVKIKAQDGKEYLFQVVDVAQFTRELSEEISTEISTNENGESTKPAGCSKTAGFPYASKWSSDYKMKEKGFFVEFDLLAATNSAAFRVTHGYKLGKLGSLGVALGLENLATARKSMSGVPAATLNLVYSKELFKRKVTPFFQVEGGYGIALKRTTSENDYNFFDKEEPVTDFTDALYFGGPMSGLVLGLKIKTKKKVIFKLGLDARMVSQFSTKTYTIIYEDASTKNYKKDEFKIFPGVGARFGIGF